MKEQDFIRVALLDHEANCGMYKLLLEMDGDMEVATVSNHRDFLEIIRSNNSQIALTDLRIEGDVQIGYDVISSVKERFPHIKIVVISASDSSSELFDNVQRAGASAFISRRRTGVSIRKVIKQVYNNDDVFLNLS